MQPVIRYSRRSSEQGDNYSLDTQDAAILKYVRTADLGESESFQQQITGTGHLRDRRTKEDSLYLWGAIEERSVKALVVYSLDRLSRARLVDALTLIEDIIRLGCELHACDVGRITSADDIGIIIRSWQSNEERKKIIDRLMRGKLGKAATGWTGSGPTPYGYVKVGQGKTAQLQIDEPRAAVVRWMFEWYAGGATLRGLETELNQRGIASPAGGLWRGPGSVSAILRRPVYCGRVTFDGVCVVDERVRITTVEVYERVQDRLRYNIENSRRNTQNLYIMRGFVTCYCGHKMGISSKQYKCDALSYPRGHPGRCVGSIHISRVDAIVTEYIRWAVSPEVIRVGIEEKERLTVAQLQSRSVADIDADIARREAGIMRLMRQFASGDDAAQITIGEIRDEVVALRAERERLINAEATAQSRRAARESIAAHVARLRGLLDDPSPQLLRDLAEVMSVRAQLRRDETGARALVVSCETAGEVVYEL